MKRFIDCIIPFRTCNLRCKYCYITHTKSWGQKLPEFHYNADHIGQALSVKRLGGISLINICGEGETLLPPEIIDIVYNILKNGHYVMIVTNGTVSKRFNQLTEFPVEYLNRLLFKFSFHYLELKRKTWLNIFFENIRKVRKVGCSISLELTPCDEAIPHIDEIISLSVNELEAKCHITVARDEKRASLPILTKYSRTEYENIWNTFDSDLFKFKMQVFNRKIHEYCYAGLWSCVLNLVTGDLKQCYGGKLLQNIYNDTERPIKFSPIGHHCRQPHCYNAHAFMTLGVIPSIITPPFAEMRNRFCNDGSEWLTPVMKSFLQKKLKDENDELNRIKKNLFKIQDFAKSSRHILKHKFPLRHPNKEK